MNSQSDGKNKLKRIEFVFNKKAYKFALNPEEYNQSEPNRATLTQTKAGGWLDEFGAGLPIITIKGTTGFKAGTKDSTNGFKKFEELRDMIRNVYNRVKPGQTVPSSKEFKFYNYTDGEYWIVTPKVFELLRSVARPHLYTYNIQLMCQRRVSDPNSKDKASNTSSKSGTRRMG